jgi:serine/threonine protein kinase
MEKLCSNQETGGKTPMLPGFAAKRLLGRGAFGDVWLAEDMCGLFYAAKVIYRDNPNHPEAETREFRGLRHYLGVSRENDHLAQIYFVGASPDHRFFYYVMELADDANGQDRVRVGQYVPRTLAYEINSRSGPSPVRDVIQLGQCLLRGLSYLHERHLVHRDLKPSNVIFRRGEPTLSDFGLVCLSSKWNQAERIGTPYYTPDRGKGTHSADLYALGKILWTYWTGRDVADFPSLPHELLENSPKGASNRLNEVINRACHEEPSQRYQGWSEMWRDLMAIDQTHYPAPVPVANLPAPEPSLSLPAAPVSIISRSSPFYIRREVDQQLNYELEHCRKQGGIIRIKGARQSGKSSLVARALERARDGGFQVIMADFRQLNRADFASLEIFYEAFARLIAMSLASEAIPYNSTLCSPNQKLTEFMELEVFRRLGGAVLLAMDNIDRLIRQPYSPEVFSLMRSWYEFRETRKEPWRRFTLLVAYADDEMVLEERMSHSPFNVGIRLELTSLPRAGIEQLNAAYGSPLSNPEECSRFCRLTGGQPFLVNFGLYELARKKSAFAEFESAAHEERGVYRDQLQRMRRLVEATEANREAMLAVVKGKGCPTAQSFLELQSLGVLSGSQKAPRFCCELYERFFSKSWTPGS